MCGIVGSYGFSNEKIIRRMLEVTKHRGPDDTDYLLEKNCMLGINRLSILDIKLGKQPMSLDDQSLHIVFNGEIFNYLELNIDLKKKGCSFKTSNSDTETILNGYKIYGSTFFEKLNGMFAIAIYDKKKNKLILCRDRAGIKPLFYSEIIKKFFFASEIKALLSIPFFKKNPNEQAIYNYFGLKNIPNPLTAFKNIYQVRPGEIITLSENNIKKNFFWDLTQKKIFYKRNVSENKILKTLDEAVKRQMRSDVEVGCFLSGGLDSSAIAKIACKYTEKKLKTFSIVYENKIKSKSLDNVLSKKMSKLINSEHHELNINYENLKKELDNSINCFDQPFAGTTSSYFLSKFTSKYVKVALSGDGADELFGSYIFPRLCEAKKIWSNKELRSKFLKNSTDVKNDFINFDKVNKMKIYEIKDYFMTLNENDKKKYLNQSKTPKFTNINYLKKIFDRYKNETDLTNLALKIDFKTILPDQVLSFVDILSMNSSLEIRPPFLDNEMINLAFTISGSKKIIDSNPKMILKKSLSKILPREIIDRKKEGFILPVEEMYIKRNIKKIKNTLSEKNLNRHSYLNFEQISNLIKNINKNNFYENNKIWIFYCFQTWWNKNF